MKKIILAAIILIAAITMNAQTGKNQTLPADHKIVFQLSTDDTLAHKALMKQLNNILTIAPGTKMEVVCHGPGLSMLVISKSIVQDKIMHLKNQGIEFVACEFSMSERNVTKEQIVPQAGFVKGGIIEIITRQEQGWSYIKTGF